MVISDHSAIMCLMTPSIVLRVLNAVDSFPPKKMPVIDGLSIEFYSIVWTIAHYFQMLLVMHRGTMFSPKQCTIINVMTKPGQEVRTSLINTDNKIITKDLNNQTTKVCPNIIHYKQTRLDEAPTLQT